MALLVAVCCASWAAGVNADEIRTGKQTYRRAAVTDYRNGMLEIRKLGGIVERIGIWNVEMISLEDAVQYGDFNEAEQFLVQQDPAQAVVRYERSLRSAETFWPDVISARLLLAAQRGGQYDKAVRVFLDMAERDPVAAAHLIPGEPDDPHDAQTTRALRRIEKTLEEPANETVRVLAELLRCEHLSAVGGAQSMDACRAVATTPIDENLMSLRVASIQLAAMRKVLDAGEAATILPAIDGVLRGADESLLPRVLLLKAQAQLASAANEQDYLAAALPAMRVVIHFPASQAAGDAYLLSATALESSGRTADAMRVLRDCLIKEQIDDAVKQQARTRLAAMNSAKGS